MNETGGEGDGAGLWVSAVRAIACLTAVMLASWWVYVRFFLPGNRPDGRAVAALAAGVCWISSVAALVVTLRGAKSPNAMAGVLGGTLFRTGGPLAAMAVGSQIPRLARQGFAEQLVVFFLVSLAAETLLATVILKRQFHLKFWR